MERKEVMIGVVGAVVVVASWALYTFLTDRGTEEGQLLPHRIVHRDILGGNASLSIVVEPDSPKEKVMELARHFRQEYGSYPQVFMNIYDSEEVWRRHRDESYSSRELYEHWLVHMVYDREDGYDEMHWMQEIERE